MKDPDNESVEQNDKGLQWNQNWLNDSIPKMGEIEGAKKGLENEKVKAKESGKWNESGCRENL